MCLAAASYALAASSAVSNVPSHNRAPRFGSRISAAQLFVVCLLMSASLFNKKKEYFCGEFGREILPLQKREKYLRKKREKKEVFSYLPHGLCRTPRYTEEHCFLVFVLVDPPCWAVVPPPPSKEEGSSLAFCFKKKTKTKTKKKWGSLERRKLIRKIAGKKRLFQKGNNKKKTVLRRHHA